MTRRIAIALLMALSALAIGPAASAQPSQQPALPFIPDCKDAPTPDIPGQGLSAFFSNAPDKLPPKADPFKPGAKTTIYEQYGMAGLRFTNYDLGCGPDAARDPGAVIGTSLSNWMLQIPLALTAMTASLTGFAFHPTFLNTFDPVLTKVSTALHDSLFATWLPLVLAALGIGVIIRARRAALATTAAGIGWAILVVLLATALFRWPVEAGHMADQTVTSTLGATVSHLDGSADVNDPGTAVASQVESAILYRAWLAGTLGSADSDTARKYGGELFDAQALTWREAAEIDAHPERAEGIIKAKKAQWADVANKIKAADPTAYDYLTGKRSEGRVGYAMLASIATLLALPFLLFSSLLLLGCFLIVRLAVMMFPAFATLGAFPSARGLVIGLGRVVGAAVVNSIVFGVGAGVTIMVLGILFAPGNGAPGWLGLVLMPLFTYLMWKALRPFRRLTEMVSTHDRHFGDMVSTRQESQSAKRWLRRTTAAAVGAYTGNVAAAATIADKDEEPSDGVHEPPTRAEARPTPSPVVQTVPALPAAPSPASSDEAPKAPSPPASSPGTHPPGEAMALRSGFVPRPTMADAPPAPVEPELIDGEEIFTIYRPSDDAAPDAVDEVA